MTCEVSFFQTCHLEQILNFSVDCLLLVGTRTEIIEPTLVKVVRDKPRKPLPKKSLLLEPIPSPAYFQPTNLTRFKKPALLK